MPNLPRQNTGRVNFFTAPKAAGQWPPSHPMPRRANAGGVRRMLGDDELGETEIRFDRKRGQFRTGTGIQDLNSRP